MIGIGSSLVVTFVVGGGGGIVVGVVEVNVDMREQIWQKNLHISFTYIVRFSWDVFDNVLQNTKH